MPSLKSRVVAFYLRHTRKKAFSSPVHLNAWIARARLNEDHRPPVSLSQRLNVRRGELVGRPVYEVTPTQGPCNGRLIYLHGGAYCFEITSYHWALIAELAERLSMQVTVPIYPLAPEHSYREIFEFGLQVWRQVFGESSAEQVFVVGDSAGGNMAAVLEMMAAQEGLPKPARQVLISPGLDMTLEGDEIYELEKRDPWLGIKGGLEAIRHYAGDLELADWRISPVKGDLSALPPSLILAGGQDLLTPGSTLFAELARNRGVDIQLEIEPYMFHVWPLIDMPEARTARDRIVAYLSGSNERRPASPVRQQPSVSS